MIPCYEIVLNEKEVRSMKVLSIAMKSLSSNLMTISSQQW